MSRTLKRNAAFIKLLHHASPRTRNVMLKSHCTDDFINWVNECCVNVLKGSVPLTKAQFEPLRRRRRTLRALSLKKTWRKEKRKLIQTGGFLGLLLGPIVRQWWNTLGKYCWPRLNRLCNLCSLSSRSSHNLNLRSIPKLVVFYTAIHPMTRNQSCTLRRWENTDSTKKNPSLILLLNYQRRWHRKAW